MAVKNRMSEEDIIQSINQTKQSLELQKKDQRWLYLLVVGSFALMVFLNYTFTNIYSVEKRPYNIKSGFIGLILTFFGFTLFLNVFFFKSTGKGFILFAIICVILLYYGLPLLLNFKW